MKPNADLFEIVITLRSPSGFPRLLHGWQEQRHQDSDDGNDHQQFDQSKSATMQTSVSHCWTPEKVTNESSKKCTCIRRKKRRWNFSPSGQLLNKKLAKN